MHNLIRYYWRDFGNIQTYIGFFQYSIIKKKYLEIS